MASLARDAQIRIAELEQQAARAADRPPAPVTPLIRHDSLPQELCRGVHRLAHSWFVVSRGLGFSSWRFRVFCPAEVIELRLRDSS